MELAHFFSVWTHGIKIGGNLVARMSIVHLIRLLLAAPTL